MSLKALKEKQNRLLNELEEMVSSLEVEGEIRSLTKEERETFDIKKNEIDEIDATIKRIEETRARNVSPEAEKELMEKRSKKEIEERAVENFFRGMDLGTEERSILTASSKGQALMPVTIAKTLMKKLEEQCPILEMARRFSSKGTLRLIKEDNYGAGAITGENVAFHGDDVDFETVELRAFKVTAMAQATFEMLQNSEIELSNYLLDVIVRRLAKELNRLFLVGDGSSKPQGLTNGTFTQEISAEVKIQDFIDMQTALHPSYLDKACWIVNRKTFQAMGKMLDGNGRPYLISNYDNVNNKIQYTLLGVPVIVDVHMPEHTTGNASVILANLGEAYAINVLTDITVRHLTETGFTQGYEVFAGYVMVDGRIINNDAVVVGKVSAGKAAAKASK